MSDDREYIEFIIPASAPMTISGTLETLGPLLAAQAENEYLRAALDRQQRQRLYRRVIEKYNRAHAHNKKITMKQVCEQMGVSYDAVRTFRSRTGKRKSQK
jgi:hypothetical protein